MASDRVANPEEKKIWQSDTKAMRSEIACIQSLQLETSAVRIDVFLGLDHLKVPVPPSWRHAPKVGACTWSTSARTGQ